MDFGLEMAGIFFKMVVMISCVVGGTFLGMFLRKKKDLKVTTEEK